MVLCGVLAVAACLTAAVQASAQPAVSVKLSDVATTRWDGAAANANIGQLGGNGGNAASATGDVNGDGRQDLAVDDRYNFGLYILFSSAHGKGHQTLGNLAPSDGYKIQLPDTTDELSYEDAGDQNGDGLADLVVAMSYYDPVTYDLIVRDFVVYGVADPSTLPACGLPDTSRCVTLESIVADGHGYELGGGTEGNRLGLDGVSTGDFDGDGIKDIALTAGDPAGNSVYVVKGKARTGVVDVTSLPSDEVIRVTGPSPKDAAFGVRARFLDDVNGDGKAEPTFITGLFTNGGSYILYGRPFSAGGSDLAIAAPGVLPASDGLYVATSVLSLGWIASPGDLNGDGQADLAIGSISLADQNGGAISVEYLPKLPSGDPILTGDDMEPGAGYSVQTGGDPAQLGLKLVNAADVNGDGLDDLLAAAPNTGVTGSAGAGAAYVLFSKSVAPTTPFNLGASLTPENGIALVGATTNGKAGTTVSSLGDIDGDGLSDFVVGAPGEKNNGLNGSGSVYIVPGKALIARAETLKATDVSDTAATSAGTVASDQRDAKVWFEYGASASYGASTAQQDVPASGRGVAVEAALSSLAPQTTYHYRVVAKNSLGLIGYGADRTFTTGKTPDAVPPPGNPTVKDPCVVNPKAAGCSGYDYCAANPTAVQCKKPVGALGALIVSPKSASAKRGKKVKVTVSVTNTGNAAAAGVKVCLKAPSALVKGAKCVSVGSLAAGKTVSKSFSVTVQKKAKRGKKASLSFTASGTGLKATTAKASVKVK